MKSEYNVESAQLTLKDTSQDSSSKKKSSESINSSFRSITESSLNNTINQMKLYDYKYTKKDFKDKKKNSYEENISFMKVDQEDGKKKSSESSGDLIQKLNNIIQINGDEQKKQKEISSQNFKTRNHESKNSQLIQRFENGKVKSHSSANSTDIVLEDIFKEKEISQDIQKKSSSKQADKNEQQVISTIVISKPISEIKKESYFNDKGILVEKIFADQHLAVKREFESNLRKEISISNEKYEETLTNLPSQFSEKPKEKGKMNVLKRELGLELPQKKKKKKGQNEKNSKVQESIKIENNGQTINNDTCTQIKNEREEISYDDSEVFQKSESIQKENSSDDDNFDEENDDDSQNNSYSSNSSHNNNKKKQLRRSGRVKKAPQSLDNNIYRIYQQKKAVLKKKEERGEEITQSKQSSSETKQSDTSAQASNKNKKNEKSKKIKTDSKAQKSTISKKQKYDYSSEKDSRGRNSESDENFNDTKRKPLKKIKQQEDNLDDSFYRRTLLFQDIESWSDEDKKLKNNFAKQNNKRKLRNLDTKEDDLTQEDDNTMTDNSFQILLDEEQLEPNQKEELAELGYVLDKLNGYDIDNQYYQNYKDEDEGDDDDIPLHLPDLDLEDSKENENKMISQLEGNIDLLEQKIIFLREDSKLKKHSMLNEKNYEEYQHRELKRLQDRKAMIEQQIVEKKRLKIEKYRQSLHYFNQIPDPKCIPCHSNNRKVLINNIDDQIPANRLIKYKQQQSIEKSREIDLCYFPHKNIQEFEIIGFSTFDKVAQKKTDNNQLIHNFFTIPK